MGKVKQKSKRRIKTYFKDYVYIIIDMRPEFFGRIIYVGLGSGNRIYRHYDLVLKGKETHNKELTRILQEHVKLELIPKQIIVKSYPDRKKAEAAETALIKHIGLEKLVNRHANDLIFKSSVLDENLEIPDYVQILAVTYNSKKHIKGLISHAIESYHNHTIGVGSDSATSFRSARIIKTVKKYDIILLYDNVPKSGIHGLGLVLDGFTKRENQLWTNIINPRSYPYQLNIEWLAFDSENPFEYKNIPRSAWMVRPALVNLTNKQDFIKEVFNHFGLSDDTFYRYINGI